ncbi:MAG TPA: YceI family protein [Pseudonocardiaceae bacterium]
MDDTVEIPLAGDYRIDPENSTISFTIKHVFGLGTVRGTFQLAEGHIQVADPVHGSHARATIAAASVRTNNRVRDRMVRSAQYLDAGNHPDITFHSTRLDEADGHWVLGGTLSAHGNEQPQQVDIHQLRVEGPRLRLRASSVIDRYVFGVNTMKGMAGRRLSVELDITAELEGLVRRRDGE